MRIERGPGWELRLGRWQDVLEDVECDALITDPPYSARTHGAYREMPKLGRNAIGYASLDEAGVAEIVEMLSPRCRGWFAAMHDHGLAGAWGDALAAAGRYVFAPLSCVEPGSRVRMLGDGPSQWAVWLTVARPRTREAMRWGALPGAYVVPHSRGWRGRREARSGVTGGKPLWLMRQIVSDYSRPGDLVCDPFAGGATTLLAAVQEGRRAIGAECDPETFDLAVSRLRRGFTPVLPGLEAAPVSQGAMFDE